MLGRARVELVCVGLALTVLLVTILPSSANKLKGPGGKKNFSWFSNEVSQLEQKGKVLHDMQLTTPELISEQGYPAEIHYVETKDGYILEMHRIPYGINRAANSTQKRPAVFLLHCFLCSSSDWIMNTPDKALAYMLADFGYDVWMGNARGNTYSRRHVFLKPDDPVFWQFSWNEMGQYDAPAMIDYVLNTTQHEKLRYVGFSLGTTILFTMMHYHPQYNDKISGMVAMAPIAYNKHIRGPLSLLIQFGPLLSAINRKTGGKELLQSTDFRDFVIGLFCTNRKVSSLVCHNIMFIIMGPSPKHVNKDFLPLFLANTPSGTSLQTMVHLLQMAKADKFQMYDYGLSGNLRKYGLLSPPEYNITQVKTPIAIFYAANDWLATIENVKRLLKTLPNVVGYKSVPDSFSHMDFVWAKDAAKFVYKSVLRVLKEL